MGVFEKTLFFLFGTICIITFGFILQKVSDRFSVEVPTSGGSITEGVIGYPRYINPVLSVTDAGKDIGKLVYSGLLKAKADGTLQPDLAKDWSVSDDGLTYTVNIKDDAVFQDGYPVTADDIEYTIKKAIDPVIKSPVAANWDGVQVTVVNAKQIQFILKKPYTPFIQNLTLGILPQHVWQNVDAEAFPFSQFNSNPIGSGPYKIKEIKTDKGGLPLYYKLVPFEKYSLGKPLLSAIYIRFYENENKLVDAYVKGEIDSLGSISPNSASLLASKGARIIQEPLPRIFALFFNQNQNKIFTDINVRKALNTAVNRNEIIQSVLGGYGTPVEGPLPYFVSPTQSDLSGNETSDQRIEAAKAILEKAGWKKNSDGIYQLTVKKVTMTLAFSISTSDVPELKAVSQKLQETWQKLGAKVDVQVFDSTDLEQNVIRPRKYDSLLFGEVVNRGEDLYAFWHSSERNDPGLNVAMYTNIDVDKLLNQARTTTSVNDLAAIYQKLGTEISADIPAVFIYSPDFIYVISNNLKGINTQGINSPSERFLSASNWYTDTEKIWKIFVK
ncbi:MAG: peptide ABC transporter substrate-binding protein [bacterium]